jgi:predicted ATPase/DNA-binding CsgD family transcriptional regulator
MSREAYTPLIEPLTAREQEVLQLLAQEKSDRQVADELVLSLHTVKWYNRQIYGKLGVENREAAVAQARALGLVAGQERERPNHYLPLPLSSFVGRERELYEVRRALSSSRLVTLTGAGGCGKSRLALQTALSVLLDFPDGVWLVELAPLSDATLVAQEVAEVLGLPESTERAPLASLTNYLRDRKLLLVLDNCEHLIEAVARLAGTLLRHCAHLQILATSRESLAVAGELVWLVPSLILPEPEADGSLAVLAQSDAVRLFMERAAAALPDFTLTAANAGAVEQVCRRLDGIPLALELAAARVRMFRVEQIAARLDDRFQFLVGGSRADLPRHQTLAALIDWSYELLTPAEQRLLRRLSVFAGAFTLEAAEAACSGEGAGDVLDGLAQLVNKSLVVVRRKPGQEALYDLLETIRHYAWSKLQAAGEAEQIRARHLAYFLQLAETAEPYLQTREQLLWLDRLEAEYDNLRAALDWSLNRTDEELEDGLRLATALAPFWFMRSHYKEGRHWLDVALGDRNHATLAVQARLLLHAGWLLYEQSEGSAIPLLEESLALYRQLEDLRGIAWAMGFLGLCDRKFTHQLDDAVSRLSESVGLAQQLDDKALLTKLYRGWSWVVYLQTDYLLAADLATRGLALAQEIGERRVQVELLFILGGLAWQQNDNVRGTAIYHEALALTRELKDPRMEAVILNNLGEGARLTGAYEQAASYYLRMLSLARELDVRLLVALAITNLGMLSLAVVDLPKAASRFRECTALWSEIEPERNWTIAHGFGGIALARGQWHRAAVLLSAAARMLELEPFHPKDLENYERDKALIRAQLGEEAFAAAWAEGAALSLDEAVALALAEPEAEG